MKLPRCDRHVPEGLQEGRNLLRVRAERAPKNFKFNASNNLALALVEQDDESKKQRALGLADNNVSIIRGSAKPARPTAGSSTNSTD